MRQGQARQADELVAVEQQVEVQGTRAVGFGADAAGRCLDFKQGVEQGLVPGRFRVATTALTNSGWLDEATGAVRYSDEQCDDPGAGQRGEVGHGGGGPGRQGWPPAQ